MHVESYRPTVPDAYWNEVQDFVQPAVLQAAPHLPYRVSRLTTDLTSLAVWAWQSAGLPLERDILLHRDVIEAHVVHGCPHLSRTSAGNRRSTLLRIAEVLLPPTQRVSRLTPLCNPSPSQPYRAKDLQDLRAWARGQNTEKRRRDCHTLLSLGLGAGLSAREIKLLRIGDITADRDGVLIHVREERPRAVPVLAVWEEHLVALTTDASPDRLAFAPNRINPASRNAVSNFVARTVGMGTKPNSHRMRATWIVQHLASGTPLIPFMEAAGLETLEVLDRYMTFTPGVKDISQARFLLRRKLDISPGLRSP